MAAIEVSKQQVKNYLISRSFLCEPADDLLTVLEKLTCIQVDPINVIARTHELALWNRVKNFQISDLYSELYEKRNLFEYWLQLFSIIHIKYYPYLTARMHIKGDWQDEYGKKHVKEIAAVREFVTTNGVTNPKQISHLNQAGRLFTWTGGPSTRTAALEYLWDRGELVIHHRERNQRYYDLAERTLPTKVLSQKVSQQESIDFILKSHFQYWGMVRKSFLGRSGYVRSLPIKQRLFELAGQGEILPLKIENVKTQYYILKSQLTELKQAPDDRTVHHKLNILPPLDPLVIDRRILLEIFDFYYQWEVYVPPAKRKFGYYSLPLLYEGEFVGQIELRKTKDDVELLNLETTVRDAEFQSALSQEIYRLKQFVHGG